MHRHVISILGQKSAKGAFQPGFGRRNLADASLFGRKRFPDPDRAGLLGIQVRHQATHARLSKAPGAAASSNAKPPALDYPTNIHLEAVAKGPMCLAHPVAP